MPIFRIHSEPGDRDRIAEQVRELGGRVLASYGDNTLTEVPDNADGERLGKTFAVRDVTPQYGIQGSGRQIDTFQVRIDRDGIAHPHPDYADEPPLPEGPHHYLVQFVGPIKKVWLEEVVGAGGEPRAPYQQFTYVVRAEPEAIARIAGLDCVRWVGHLPYRDRLSPSIHNSEPSRSASDAAMRLPGTYTVEFFQPFDADAAKRAVEQQGYQVVAVEPEAGVLIAQTGAEEGQEGLEQLSRAHGVKMIRPRFLPRIANNFAIQWMGVARAIDDPRLGLNGAGQVVAVCDSGLDNGNRCDLQHRDFGDRVAHLIPYPIAPDLLEHVDLSATTAAPWTGQDTSGHGTHVAGSVLGDGTESKSLPVRLVKGLAPAATLVFQAVGREVAWRKPRLELDPRVLSGLPINLGDLFQSAYEADARIHCNAWNRSGGEGGEYDEWCKALDDFVWRHKDFCVVVAAGNADDDELGANGEVGSSSLRSPGAAKNCITVGASGTRRSFPDRPPGDPERVLYYSCRGPAEMARNKPDVVAPADFILSARSSLLGNETGPHRFGLSTKYFFLGGTSQATALVTGAVVLLRQYLVGQGFTRPSAALLKAALIAGATRLPTPSDPEAKVVDSDQGYGRVNLDAVVQPKNATVRFLDNTHGLAEDECCLIDVDVRSSDIPLRAVLAYTDRPGPYVVNHLDLTVRRPAGAGGLLKGNQPKQPRDPPDSDTSNNVEVVEDDHPAVGRWRIEVKAEQVPRGRQAFALVYRCAM